METALQTYTTKLTESGFGPGYETVPTSRARGRITARAVYAKACAPHYNSCAMDGVALAAVLTAGATETTPVTVNRDNHVPVNTGDPLPEGCDCVVMIEDITGTPGTDITVTQAASPWQHVRQIGEDICQGDMILASFTAVTPAAAGALLAAGVTEVEVIRRPLAGIIPTGNELAKPSAGLTAGQIPEFNSVIFTGMIEEWGGVAITYDPVADEPSALAEAINRAVKECDVVLIGAGTSAGSKDYTVDAVECPAVGGEVICHGVSIRPGKPVILALAGKPVIGVPGYPVSGIIVLEAFVLPLIDYWFKRPPTTRETAEAVLSKRVVSSLKYKEFVRVKAGRVGGRLVAVPLARGAGVVSSFVKADAIMEIPQDSEGAEAGETVTLRLLRPLRELDRTLVITGSHDPLIDEAADILRRRDYSVYAASTHVGSMGGLMAIKRGEAHLAGVHLLDEATGQYNRPFVERHFLSGGVRLIPCVKRSQGFMVAAGNPKKIKSYADIAQQGLTYVNRQNGSGTRILCDYLLKKSDIPVKSIAGYDREEYTHTNVAAIVASGGADAGLGIYAAARMYGLDFVPVWEEEYDLLASEDALELDIVRQFIDVLAGKPLKARLTELGGYRWI